MNIEKPIYGWERIKTKYEHSNLIIRRSNWLDDPALLGHNILKLQLEYALPSEFRQIVTTAERFFAHIALVRVLYCMYLPVDSQYWFLLVNL